jgi:hypothetical protein
VREREEQRGTSRASDRSPGEVKQPVILRFCSRSHADGPSRAEDGEDVLNTVENRYPIHAHSLSMNERDNDLLPIKILRCARKSGEAGHSAAIRIVFMARLAAEAETHGHLE